MAGNGSRGGSGRSAGGSTKRAAGLGLKAVDQQSRRQERLQQAIGMATRQLDRLRQRRKAVVKDGAFSQGLDRRIVQRQELIKRLQTEKGRLRDRAGKRNSRLSRMRRRGSTAPDFPATWPTGRQLWSGRTSPLGSDGKLK